MLLVFTLSFLNFYICNIAETTLICETTLYNNFSHEQIFQGARACKKGDRSESYDSFTHRQVVFQKAVFSREQDGSGLGITTRVLFTYAARKNGDDVSEF